MALTAQSLTTLAALKAELSLTSSSDDAYLEALIERASERLVSLCGGRAFHYSAPIVERVAGYATRFLLISRRPLLAIASITAHSTTLTADSYAIHDAQAGVISRVYGAWGQNALGWGVEREPISGSETREYTVTYSGGWVTPTQATGELPRSLPHDIEAACLALAVQEYRQRGRDLSVTSKKVLSASVGYAQGGAALPPSVEQVVMRYREVAL